MRIVSSHRSKQSYKDEWIIMMKFYIIFELNIFGITCELLSQ